MIVQLLFTGSRNGRFFLACDSSFAHELTEQVLGEKVSATDLEVAEDTVKELINMISGVVLVDGFGPDYRFDLVPPHVDDRSYGIVQQDADVVRAYQVGRHTIFIGVQEL